MSDSWTHYDNLKVSPRADPEVIRAAYRALAQKWHPDKHPPERKARCERVMHLINDAYRVLSDPATRARYDESLAAQRADAASGRAHASGDTRAAAGAHPRRTGQDGNPPAESPADMAPGEDDIAGLSHYDLLDLGWDASLEQVELARAVAVAKWHPLRHPPQQEHTCERMQAAIARAAACLSDPATRRAYNGELMRRNPQAWTRAHERRRPRGTESFGGGVGCDGAEQAAHESRQAGDTGTADRPQALRPRWMARSGDRIAAWVDSVRASIHRAGSGTPHEPAAVRPDGRDGGAAAN